MDFTYVLDKIEQADIVESPFKLLKINDLLEPEHFEQIVRTKEITLAPAKNDSELLDVMLRSGYRVINFPGCVLNPGEYIEWHREKRKSHNINTSCEGFGLVLRLAESSENLLTELQRFFFSEQFLKKIAAKLDVDINDCVFDGGIQKYLDGYEISPHADIRRKALTFMMNINPDPCSHNNKHHTSLMQFKSQWQYVEQFWRGNPEFDRCWVPWSWCESRMEHRENNSIVIFSPSDSTLHAVKADYDHLIHQRTQLYGNLWLKNYTAKEKPKWEDLVITASPKNLRQKVTATPETHMGRSFNRV